MGPGALAPFDVSLAGSPGEGWGRLMRLLGGIGARPGSTGHLLWPAGSTVLDQLSELAIPRLTQSPSRPSWMAR